MKYGPTLFEGAEVLASAKALSKEQNSVASSVMK